MCKKCSRLLCLCVWKTLKEMQHNIFYVLLELLLPIILALVLFFIVTSTVEYKSSSDYNHLCADHMAKVNGPTAKEDCPVFSKMRDFKKKNYSVVYAPTHKCIQRLMNKFHSFCHKVIGYETIDNLREFLANEKRPNISTIKDSNFEGDEKNVSEKIFAVEFNQLEIFKHNYEQYDECDFTTNMRVSLRFPGDWQTELVFPVKKTFGPREPESDFLSEPDYYNPEFLHAMVMIVASSYITLDAGAKSMEKISQANIDGWNKKWFDQDFYSYPAIYLKRFPNGPWVKRKGITDLALFCGLFVNISTFFTFLLIVRTIAIEKEKHLRTSMKLRGFHEWAMWLVLYLRGFLMLMVGALVFSIVLKIANGDSPPIFPNTDYLLILVLLTLNACCVVAFAILIGVMFTTGRAATLGVICIWPIITGIAVFHHVERLKSLDMVIKSCLIPVSPIFHGFRIMNGYEDLRLGSRWNNMCTASEPYALCHIYIMLIIVTLICLLLALYIDALNPGEGETPKTWDFPFTASYWFGVRKTRDDNADAKSPSDPELFEDDLRDAFPGIRTRNLEKVFGDHVVLKNVSLTANQGHITVLLGPAGAGKTTFVSILAGYHRPTKGTALIEGHDIRTSRKGIMKILGTYSQHNILFSSFTVQNHLYFACRVKGLTGNQRKSESWKYLNLLNLDKKKRTRVRNLPEVEQKKLCIAMALIGPSEVVVLDEPTAGLDEPARQEIWDLLQGQKKGRTILLTTESMEEANQLGNKIIIIQEGTVVCSGSKNFLQKKYGTGYFLTVETTTKCNPDRVTSLIRSHIYDLKVSSDMNRPLKYLLPAHEIYFFERMLSDMERHSYEMGVTGYSMKMSTMDELYDKVGEQYNTQRKGQVYKRKKNAQQQTDPDNNGPGICLVLNQWLAMTMKRFYFTLSAWKFLLLMLLIAVCLPLSILMVHDAGIWQPKGGPLELNLAKFYKPITLVEEQETIWWNHTRWKQHFKQFIEEDNNQITPVPYGTLETKIREIAETQPNFGQRYIIGLSIRQVKYLPELTGYFHGDPAHSIAIVLAYMLRAIFYSLRTYNRYYWNWYYDGYEKKWYNYTYYYKPPCRITWVNYPIPRRSVDEEKGSAENYRKNNFAQFIAFDAMMMVIFLTLACLLPLYVVPCMREKVSRLMRLQFLSGQSVCIYWLAFFFYDMLLYAIAIFAIVLCISCHYLEGYWAFDELGTVFLMMLCYGFAIMPFLYILGRVVFRATDLAVCITLLILVLGGLLGIFYNEITLKNSEKLFRYRNVHLNKDIKFRYLCPFINLGDGIENMMFYRDYHKLCNFSTTGNCTEFKNLGRLSLPFPGVGQNCLFFLLTGLILLLLLILIDIRCCSSPCCRARKPLSGSDKKKKKPSNVDDDVWAERQMIVQTPLEDLTSAYSVVLIKLTKNYGKGAGVDELYLALKPGECFCLLGPDGAGKTTTLQMLSGSVRPTKGDSYVHGYSMSSSPGAVYGLVGYCPQEDYLLEELTPRQTLRVFAMIRGESCKESNRGADFLAEDLHFRKQLDQRIRTVNAMDRRKVSTAVAFVGSPPALYLDEPTRGMYSSIKKSCLEGLKKNCVGKTVIITSNDPDECRSISTKTGILIKGHLVCLGTSSQMTKAHTEGYILKIKVKGNNPNDIVPFMEANFPSAKWKEQNGQIFTYHIESRSISKIFAIMKEAKMRNLNITEFAMSHASLDQVYVQLSKDQK